MYICYFMDLYFVFKEGFDFSVAIFKAKVDENEHVFWMFKYKWP